jgi:hypothetical protein
MIAIANHKENKNNMIVFFGKQKGRKLCLSFLVERKYKDNNAIPWPGYTATMSRMILLI